MQLIEQIQADEYRRSCSAPGFHLAFFGIKALDPWRLVSFREGLFRESPQTTSLDRIHFQAANKPRFRTRLCRLHGNDFAKGSLAASGRSPQNGIARRRGRK